MEEIFNLECVIKHEKIDNYLLRAETAKGKYFLAKGFVKDSLLDVLKDHFSIENYTEIKENNFGANFVFEGNIICPNKQEIRLRSVWHLPNSSDTVIFVTAYRIQK